MENRPALFRRLLSDRSKYAAVGVLIDAVIDSQIEELFQMVKDRELANQWVTQAQLGDRYLRYRILPAAEKVIDSLLANSSMNESTKPLNAPVVAPPEPVPEPVPDPIPEPPRWRPSQSKW